MRGAGGTRVTGRRAEEEDGETHLPAATGAVAAATVGHDEKCRIGLALEALWCTHPVSAQVTG